jgi:steroid delta-isomerase-like uncharacterized protein
MSENNKVISRRIFEEVMAGGNLDLLDEVCSPDFVNHDPAAPEEVHGIDGLKELANGYRTAFPDMRVSIEDQIAEADEVMSRWSVDATHRGELFGVPASDKPVHFEGMTIDRYRDGKLVEAWDMWDALGLMQQIGAVPAEQHA